MNSACGSELDGVEDHVVPYPSKHGISSLHYALCTFTACWGISRRTYTPLASKCVCLPTTRQVLRYAPCSALLLGRRSVYTVLDFDHVCFVSGRLFVFWFYNQGIGIGSATARLWATLLALLADRVWYMFVGFHLGRGCWEGCSPLWLRLACWMSAVVARQNWRIITMLELFLYVIQRKGVKKRKRRNYAGSESHSSQ